MACPPRIARLSTQWYVLAPPEITANHPVTRENERERERLATGGGASHNSVGTNNAASASASATSFARLSGLPPSASAATDTPVASAASASPSPPIPANITTTDGTTVAKEEVYSPFATGGFYALPSEEAVCDLILQWFEDYELTRRRKAALVVVPNEHYIDPSSSSANAVVVGGGGAASTDKGGVGTINTTSRTVETIRVQYPTVIEYDDVNVLNFAEIYLQMLVVLEPKVTSSSRTTPATSARSPLPSSSSDALGQGSGGGEGNGFEQQRPGTSASVTSGGAGDGGGVVATPFFINNKAGENNAYIFHGYQWVEMALRRYFQRQAALTEQREGV